MLFNIYFRDLPDTLSKKYGYTDNLAILLSNKNWETIESGLTADMNILSSYLTNWCLKLSVAKTMSSAFHLNNREASHELNIMVNNNRLQFQAAPTYLGVKLDHTLTFRQHLENLSAKTSAHQDIGPRRPNTSPIWYYLGRLDQDSAHLHPGTGLLHHRVLLPSLVQELPHQEAGHDAQHRLMDSLWLPACHSGQPIPDSC